MKLAQNSYNRIEKTLQWEDIKKENSLYNHIYKFLSNANKAGYGYTDVDTDKNSNEISLIFGNYKDNNEYYRIKLSNIVYKNGTEGSSKGIIKVILTWKN